jgi:[ribosomal protein S18]-alanine N-acetyltransferase
MAGVHASAWPRPWSAADFTICLNDPAMVSIAAWDRQGDGAVSGLCIFRHAAQEAELLMIAVDPAAQRTGLGLRLLEAGLTALQACGVTTCFLEVGASNPAAISLYRRLGFAEVGVRKGYYPPPAPGDSADDAIIMRLDLSIVC